MVILPSQGVKGAVIKGGGITKMKIWKGTVCIGSQIKSARSIYRGQAIMIMSIHF